MSESKGLERLQDLKDEYAALIRDGYEFRAKSCATCETKGACCLDTHFVNVHITRLEAEAIRRVLLRLPQEKQMEVLDRIDAAIEKYGLDQAGDPFAKTFACPLFEPSVGCLVHERGKPLPCISHACYENKEDLPPDELQSAREQEVESLNHAVYGDVNWLPLPVSIGKRHER
ncbi:MAG TPA: hypothetical protein VJL58_11455 [Pyrinomonadaceae bacterium]|nr:hypothetical protein [Pyrinomonadaceae bacterium]